MPRKNRCQAASLTRLITLNGHNGCAVFHKSGDYHDYLACMLDAGANTHTALHAFTLLPNRVLILATPTEEGGVSRFVQNLGRSYTQGFNIRYQRSGALWNGRFKAAYIESNTAYAWPTLSSVIRFITTTPVAAGLAARPRDYRWSAYPGRNSLPVPLTIPCPAPPVAAPISHFEQNLESATYAEIEYTLHHQLGFGREPFKAWLSRHYGIRVYPGRPGRPSVRTTPVNTSSPTTNAA